MAEGRETGGIGLRVHEVWPRQQQGDVPYCEVTAQIAAIQDKIVGFVPAEGTAQANTQYFFSMQNMKAGKPTWPSPE